MDEDGKQPALDLDNDGTTTVALIAKYGKTQHILENLSTFTTVIQVKQMLSDLTRILPKRQKLIGLAASSGGKLSDDMPLSMLKVKTIKIPSGTIATGATFILMGTPEEEILIDPINRDDLPEVIDDFDLDFNAGSADWLQHVVNGENLKKFTNNTSVYIMNEPRENKPLLVLDLDHTLLDFSSKSLQQETDNLHAAVVNAMKRPHMDTFLTTAYQDYDLVVWSQTSWRWLETKLIELGMLTHPGYKFCFVLDKTSMFAVASTNKRTGKAFQHQVKPLQLIWSKFPRWGPQNTVHLDDLSRNFALNMSNGLKVTAYHRKKNKELQGGGGGARSRDVELLGLGKYLALLARSGLNFDTVDFRLWMDVVGGKKELGTTIKDTLEKKL